MSVFMNTTFQLLYGNFSAEDTFWAMRFIQNTLTYLLLLTYSIR